jgi:hypothetical protein
MSILTEIFLPESLGHNQFPEEVAHDVEVMLDAAMQGDQALAEKVYDGLFDLLCNEADMDAASYNGTMESANRLALTDKFNTWDVDDVVKKVHNALENMRDHWSLPAMYQKDKSRTDRIIAINCAVLLKAIDRLVQLAGKATPPSSTKF